MNISVYDFKSNPFSSDMLVDIILDGNSIKILNKFGTIVFQGEQCSAKRQITNLLTELADENKITTKVVFAVSCEGIMSLVDSFRETLRQIAFEYATTNVRVEIKFAHLDYNN